MALEVAVVGSMEEAGEASAATVTTTALVVLAEAVVVATITMICLGSPAGALP